MLRTSSSRRRQLLPARSNPSGSKIMRCMWVAIRGSVQCSGTWASSTLSSVDPLLSDDATALIHQIGCGRPRAVLNLAVRALAAALTAGDAQHACRASRHERSRDAVMSVLPVRPRSERPSPQVLRASGWAAPPE